MRSRTPPESGAPAISDPPLRLGELVATLALAQDNAFGQPLESQLRSCLLASWFTADLGLDDQTRATTYWVALLRYIGCTGHAHEVSAMFGDEIELRARSLLQDAANPTEVVRQLIAIATAEETGVARLRTMLSVLVRSKGFAVHNFTTGCEVGDALARRLGFDAPVTDSLRHTFERWNGKGFPAGSAGEAIPLPMRIVHLTHDMEAIARHQTPTEVVAVLTRRRGRTYEPALVDTFAANAQDYFDRLAKVDAWDDVLEIEPKPHRLFEGRDLDEALEVVADFIDLKSPYMSGHSRRCAALGIAAGHEVGLPDAAATAIGRAALVHDLGVTAIPNSIWDKPAALTRSERDRVELHPMLTEQMLRRSPALAVLNPIAALHHERTDGSGYHKGITLERTDTSSAVLAAADVYVALTSERAHRPACSEVAAATELRRMAAAGLLDDRATEAILAAAGHAASPRRRENPARLTDREIDVLILVGRGLTTKRIAERLFISPKTVDHHVQHIYGKIEVSTRGAAALWAMQHGLVA